jgi:hypothetical protein
MERQSFGFASVRIGSSAVSQALNDWSRRSACTHGVPGTGERVLPDCGARKGLASENRMQRRTRSRAHSASAQRGAAPGTTSMSSATSWLCSSLWRADAAAETWSMPRMSVTGTLRTPEMQRGGSILVIDADQVASASEDQCLRLAGRLEDVHMVASAASQNACATSGCAMSLCAPLAPPPWQMTALASRL